MPLTSKNADDEQDEQAKDADGEETDADEAKRMAGEDLMEAIKSGDGRQVHDAWKHNSDVSLKHKTKGDNEKSKGRGSALVEALNKPED